MAERMHARITSKAGCYGYGCALLVTPSQKLTWHSPAALCHRRSGGAPGARPAAARHRHLAGRPHRSGRCSRCAEGWYASYPSMDSLGLAVHPAFRSSVRLPALARPTLSLSTLRRPAAGGAGGAPPPAGQQVGAGPQRAGLRHHGPGPSAPGGLRLVDNYVSAVSKAHAGSPFWCSTIFYAVRPSYAVCHPLSCRRR